MSIGARIKQFRNQKGLTQVKLATNAGISRSYLADVEANRYNPSLSMLMDLAQALGITASCLLDEREIDFCNLELACKDKGVSLESLSESLKLPNDSMERIRTNKLPVPTTIAAHFENTKFTEEEIEEIDHFISFLTSRRKKKQP